MTTRIELSGENMAKWIFKKEEYQVDGQKKETIAMLPDKPRIPHQTDFGVISFQFGSVENGGKDKSPIILLDCSGTSIL